MCWFRPVFAVALDCAATRAGDSAWADRPVQPHRLAVLLVQRRPQRGHAHPFPSWPWCAQGVTSPGDAWRGGRPPGSRRGARRDGATRSPAPPPGGDRVAEAVAGHAARSPGRRRRAGQVPRLPGHRPVRRRHRAGQRPARGGADDLGTAEASLGLADAERHLEEGAVLARQIGRPYLEVRCLAQLGFASKIRPLATAQRRCREAIALAERRAGARSG